MRCIAERRISAVQVASVDSLPNLRLVPNQKLEAAIKRVLSRGGKGGVDAARYDKQHHRHNKS